MVNDVLKNFHSRVSGKQYCSLIWLMRSLGKLSIFIITNYYVGTSELDELINLRGAIIMV